MIYYLYHFTLINSLSKCSKLNTNVIEVFFFKYKFYRIKTFLKVKKNYELKFLECIYNKKIVNCINSFFLTTEIG